MGRAEMIRRGSARPLTALPNPECPSRRTYPYFQTRSETRNRSSAWEWSGSGSTTYQYQSFPVSGFLCGLGLRQFAGLPGEESSNTLFESVSGEEGKVSFGKGSSLTEIQPATAVHQDKPRGHFTEFAQFVGDGVVLGFTGHERLGE